MSFESMMAACAPPQYNIPFEPIRRDTCIAAAIMCNVPSVWRILQASVAWTPPLDATPRAAAKCLLSYLRSMAALAPPTSELATEPSLFLVAVLLLARDPVVLQFAPSVAALLSYANLESSAAQIARHRVKCISGALYYNAAIDPNKGRSEPDNSMYLWPLFPIEWKAENRPVE